jgi:hypothetical protein
MRSIDTVVSGRAATGGAVIEHRPSRIADAMRDDLRLARPKIPVLDAGHDRDVLDAIPLCPFQCGRRSSVFMLSGADLLDDRVRNQDSGSEALDQVEAGDTREQNER